MREYERTHRWINFRLDLRGATPTFWMLLGEARSKCAHVAGVPLRPSTTEELNRIYLAKGVAATTAIEGNSLSEEQVRAVIEGKLELPPSKEYLQIEVRNVVRAIREIREALLGGGDGKPTPEILLRFNEDVLRDLELPPEVEPGRFRGHVVGVGRYLAAPAADCPYLVDRLCAWLNGPDFPLPKPFDGLVSGILQAVVAHLYVAWIHPFGDGNGRTARLLEFAILVAAGVPAISAHLLSNHYNETRAEYYRRLDASSKTPDGVVEFAEYALRGFVDGLAAQIAAIREQQLDVAWRNHVYERFGDFRGKPRRRQRRLVLDVSRRADGVSLEELRVVSSKVEALYRDQSDATLRSEVRGLVEEGFLKLSGGKIVPNREAILAFLPPRAGAESGDE